MARAGSSPRRFAEAAFGIAIRDGNVEAWLEQLERAAEVASDERVVRVLENPAVPYPTREQALAGILGRDAIPQLRKLAALLMRRGRVDQLSDVHRAFRQLYLRREGITEALVTSALPLDADERTEIAKRLEQYTGGQVEIDVETDAGLIGGIQVRLGDRLIDGSIRGRLERLRALLVSGTTQETI
jgi:F-type H+-transporting ATPase subunit delta